MKTLMRFLPFIIIFVLLLSLLAGAITYVLQQLNLYPPQQITIAAGKPGSAYYDYAVQYRDILARDDIELTILETNGSVENISKLAQEDAVDLALVQGGVTIPNDISGIASVQVEPLWIFARPEVDNNPNTWDSISLSSGAKGGGTRIIVEFVAEITGAMGLTGSNTLALSSDDSASALLNGELDLALFVAPVSASYLAPLLDDPQLQLISLAHSETLAIRIPGAKYIRLPSGSLNYQRPLPESDLNMIALVARLVSKKDLHPAIVNRLVKAVIEVHGGGNIIPADSLYPSTNDLGIETDKLAVDLFENGFSPLEAFLPYWIVAQFNRILLFLIPLILLLLPIFKVLPIIYSAVFNRRVYRHYARVHEIDKKLASEGESLTEEQLLGLRKELDDIEISLLQANLPNIYRKQAYTAQHHLDYVRRRLDDIQQRAGNN
uniref:TAXI family TRAP transporter solute-binding subunit n=1 Tax=Ningiella ruwaisensis TaxID=2364274 RepID=UPI001446C602|nr:TAXI family TRAP transporter solute-binding subunit [Ningiella ruwaisensis]